MLGLPHEVDNGVKLAMMSFRRGGTRGDGRGRVTQKAGYNGGDGSNGDSRDFERGGHVEINCWVAPCIYCFFAFLRGLRKTDVSIRKKKVLCC